MEGAPEAETSRRPLALDSAECRKQSYGYHAWFSLHALTVILWEIKSSTTRNQNDFQARTGTIKPFSYRSRIGIPSQKRQGVHVNKPWAVLGSESSRHKVDTLSSVNYLDTAIHGILAATRPLSGLCHQACKQAEVTGLP